MNTFARPHPPGPDPGRLHLTRTSRAWLGKSLLPGLLSGLGHAMIPREGVMLTAAAGLIWMGWCVAAIDTGRHNRSRLGAAGSRAAWFSVLLVLNAAVYVTLAWHKCLKFPLQ